MSSRMMAEVFARFPVGGNLLNLALAVADHANPDGKNIRPGVKRLAQFSKINERTVQRLMKKLVWSGWLIQTRESIGGYRRSEDCTNEYEINKEWICGKLVLDFSQTGDKLSPVTKTRKSAKNHSDRGDKIADRGDIAVSPKPSNQNLLTESVLVDQPERAGAPHSEVVSLPKKGEALEFLESLGVSEADAVEWLKMRRDGGFMVKRRNLKLLKSEAERAGLSVSEAVTIWLERGAKWATFSADWDSVRDAAAAIKSRRAAEVVSKPKPEQVAQSVIADAIELGIEVPDDAENNSEKLKMLRDKVATERRSISLAKLRAAREKVKL